MVNRFLYQTDLHLMIDYAHNAMSLESLLQYA